MQDLAGECSKLAGEPILSFRLGAIRITRHPGGRGDPVRAAAGLESGLLRFDLTVICRFVLGPYWRHASPAERQEFCDGFADRLARFCSRRLAQSGGGDFVVTGGRIAPDGVIVTSRTVRPQAAPWIGGSGSDGVYKIVDFAIDGISMALTRRSAIAALIARDGGQVPMLLATMRSGG